MAKLDIYGDGLSYVTDEVSSVPSHLANASHENRVVFVTDMAIVSRGLDPAEYYDMESVRKEGMSDEECEMILFAKRNKLFNRLMAEAAPAGMEGGAKTPSRPMEFIPVMYLIKRDDESVGLFCDTDAEFPDATFSHNEFHNAFRHGGYIRGATLYTNLRACLNAGMPYDSITTNADCSGFLAFRYYVPLFVWAQFPNTHTTISKEAQSDRVSTSTDYWLPEDLYDRINWAFNRTLENEGEYKFNHEQFLTKYFKYIPMLDMYNQTYDSSWILNQILEFMSQTDAQEFFKDLGYPLQIWQRAPYYFKYKLGVISGWMQDPTVWEHAFIEREVYPEIHKSWVQAETQRFVACIAEIIKRGDSVEGTKDSNVLG